MITFSDFSLALRILSDFEPDEGLLLQKSLWESLEAPSLTFFERASALRNEVAEMLEKDSLYLKSSVLIDRSVRVGKIINPNCLIVYSPRVRASRTNMYRIIRENYQPIINFHLTFSYHPSSFISHLLFYFPSISNFSCSVPVFHMLLTCSSLSFE